LSRIAARASDILGWSAGATYRAALEQAWNRVEGAPEEVDMDPDVAAMRQEYAARGLDEADLLEAPIEQFERWFDEARQAQVFEANAMTLATVGPDGQPAARMVLLKGVDRRGLAFFTNLESRKSRELMANPKAALLFWWGPLQRQVRLEGRIERVDDAAADAYFASRPRGSQIGAWASQQSSAVESRAVLDAAKRRFSERFKGGDVPRPDFWGGFRLVPDAVEFWQGRINRLHDRLRYDRQADDSWRISRLSP
jgi:pyridoxamine 5'-phosphate oxidase